MNSTIAFCSDGTNVNTGANTGAIRLLELHLGHPVQWFICMFHCNLLPLRHLLIYLDGTTSGPTAFSGPIGKALPKCHELPVANFESGENNLPRVLQNVTDMDIRKDKNIRLKFAKQLR